MSEVQKSDQELRFRNVTLHSQGRKEHGTLYLFRHHLLFSYLPDAQRVSRTSLEPQQHRNTTSTESSGLTEATIASTGSSLDLNSAGSRISHEASIEHDQQHHSSSHGKKAHNKQRAKEIWIPYPMINYCVLRPSHLQSQSVQPSVDDERETNGQDRNDLFPPVFGTATYARPSTDSARLAPYSSPQRPSSPIGQSADTVVSEGRGRQPAIRIRRKDLQMMALHFHSSQPGTSADEVARQAFYVLRDRCCVERIEDLHAFHYHPAKHETEEGGLAYDARREFGRMGIGGKAADGPGAAWRISDINSDYGYSGTYPSILCVPTTVSDNMLKYGGAFRSRSRIPCLAYLHPNGGSITRSSQPMVGVQNKRNPQDERLVSAIFSSHTPPLQSPEDSPPQAPSLTSPSTTTLDSGVSDQASLDNEVPELPAIQNDTSLNEDISDKAPPLRKKIYGSTRRNLIVDARPKINALANRATGGGIEDVANYTVAGGMPVEKVFLNIANIHVMRASLEKVFDSVANSDYIKIRPDQDALRKSSWLSHIANMLDGAEMVARVVGLGGSHVLVHCSDGWDRTAQVSAMAQVMLDPHYRTLDGFITLVQKDFLSFGHKFRDRDGIKGSEKWFEIENERIAPSRIRENGGTDPNSFNAFGAKALTGAKHWLEKNRTSLFRQQNTNKDGGSEESSSRPSSPPPNPLIHSPPTAKDEKEHRISEKEISPIFHQFLDTVYQLQCQYPEAFEFNERFLRRLFYHTYACQYGDFLFNCEKDRARYAGRVPSVWGHFTSRRAEFVNPDYVANVQDPLLFPRRQGSDREVNVKWWHELFGRKDEEMNIPQALASADTPVTQATMASTTSFDDQAVGSVRSTLASTVGGHISGSKSTPDLSTTNSGVANSFAGLGVQSIEEKAAKSNEQHVIPQETRPDGRSSGVVADPDKESGKLSKESTMESFEDHGDPLGVSSGKGVHSDRLDFAAFAASNAFQDR